MPRVRPEFIQATEENLPNSFLQPVWPGDIPRQCPQCGAEMHPKINLSYGYGKAGRACLKISHWITIPWTLIVFALGPFLFSLGGNGGGFALGVLMIVPAVAFAVAARICLRTRRVQCFPCKYSKDYLMAALKK
jgi:hypothetical protein